MSGKSKRQRDAEAKALKEKTEADEAKEVAEEANEEADKQSDEADAAADELEKVNAEAESADLIGEARGGLVVLCSSITSKVGIIDKGQPVPTDLYDDETIANLVKRGLIGKGSK